MKVGAEPRKVAILGVLAVIGAYVFYSNVLSTPSASPSKTPSAAEKIGNTPQAAVPAASMPPPPSIRRARSTSRGISQDFHPTLKIKPEDRPDSTTIDPTLRFDLLAKVQSVERAGGTRSLFQFAAAPVPEAPKVPVAKIIPKTPAEIAREQAAKVVEPPKPPPPPPITLKFYGYSSPRRDGQKRAFFLDGDDIFVASEGELIKRRYKVVRIGVNSVVMEDTENKNQQTLMLQAEQAG